MVEVPFDIEPALAEEGVLLALRGRLEEHEFRRERDPLYELADPELRAGAFDALHQRWFERLDLARPVWQALAGEPRIVPAVSACLLRRAHRTADEGVELLVKKPDRAGRVVRILLQVRRFLDPEPLLDFLRGEMLHVSDMLDPHFGYSPVVPDDGGVPAQLFRDRYAILWNATVDGRLANRGLSRPEIRDRRFRDFQRAFPMLEDGPAQAAFARFHTDEVPVHASLAAFASNPRAAAGGSPAAAGRAVVGVCPLCQLPSYALLPEPDSLPSRVLAAIGQDFRAWQPALGLCAQCADLYAARASTEKTSPSPCP
jgi:hypothetical protein